MYMWTCICTTQTGVKIPGAGVIICLCVYSVLSFCFVKDVVN